MNILTEPCSQNYANSHLRPFYCGYCFCHRGGEKPATLRTCKVIALTKCVDRSPDRSGANHRAGGKVNPRPGGEYRSCRSHIQRLRHQDAFGSCVSLRRRGPKNPISDRSASSRRCARARAPRGHVADDHKAFSESGDIPETAATHCLWVRG